MPPLFPCSILAAAAAALVAPALCLAAGPEATAAPPTPPAADIGDCEQTRPLTAKEACYASLPADLIDECESVRPFHCAPYRDMHVADTEMAELVAQLATTSERAYADYRSSDPTYVEDLVTAIRSTDLAWRAWRDSECMLAPRLDGMAAREIDDLAEVCRAERTRHRIETLRQRISTLEANHE